jgi:hypothetical protein
LRKVTCIRANGSSRRYSGVVRNAREARAKQSKTKWRNVSKEKKHRARDGGEEEGACEVERVCLCVSSLLFVLMFGGSEKCGMKRLMSTS